MADYYFKLSHTYTHCSHMNFYKFYIKCIYNYTSFEVPSYLTGHEKIGIMCAILISLHSIIIIRSNIVIRT